MAGTPYEGAGVLGTLGGTVNAASGGVLQSWSESLGGWLYDVMHTPAAAIKKTTLPSAP